MSFCVLHPSSLYGECLAAVLRRTVGDPVQVVDPHHEDAIARVLASRPELLLLGLLLPDRMTTEIVRRSGPPTRSLVLIPRLPVHKGRVLECVAAGTHGLFVEDGSLEELCKAVARVRGGGRYLPPDVVELVFDQLTRERELFKPQDVDRPSLTRREREVLWLIARRLTNREIATQLSVSLFTVKNHVHNILDKLQLSSRHAAVEYAVQHDLLLQAPRMPTGGR